MLFLLLCCQLVWANAGELETLTDTTWRIVHLDVGQPELTIETWLTIDQDRIYGHAGCNRFQGSLQRGTDPDQFSTGPLISTKRACEPPRMEIERAVLQRLDHIERMRRLGDFLALDYRTELFSGSLLLLPHEPTSP